jgi:hypothetical protein
VVNPAFELGAERGQLAIDVLDPGRVGIEEGGVVPLNLAQKWPAPHDRLLRPGPARIIPEEALDDSVLRRGFDASDPMLDRRIEQKRVPA